MGAMEALLVLRLAGNLLTGLLPSSYFQMVNLAVLDLVRSFTPRCSWRSYCWVSR